jgi:putative membrane protein
LLDLGFAIAHHLLVFALFGVLFAEFITVRKGIGPGVVARVAAIDMWYGILAGLVIAVGFCRAIFAAKGWAYYGHNGFFWAKIAAFALIGLLSIPPTLAYPRWRKAGGGPDDREVAKVRLCLHAQLGLFALLLACAAAMARGYGQL